MTKTFNGVACAVYGKPAKITTTCLSGTEKRNIKIVSSETHPLNPQSRLSIQVGFNYARDLAQRLAEEQEGNGRFSIVTGTESGLYTRDLFTAIARDYGDVFVTRLEGRGLDNPTVRKAERRLREAPNDLNWYAFNESVAAIIADSIENGKAKVELPRGYDCVAKTIASAGPNACVINGNDIIPQEIRQPLEFLLDKWETGDVSVQDDIRSLTQQLGLWTVGFYSLRKASTGKGWVGSRFFDAPDDLRARLYLVPGAREAYAQILISGLDIKHNICVKGKKDPRSPPFADVTAASMADSMDEITGEKPTAILVDHAVAA